MPILGIEALAQIERSVEEFAHARAIEASGLTEAPALRKATVNVGDRQKGRLKASSVIDCAEEAQAIAAAIRRALSEPFRKALPGTESLYADMGHFGKWPIRVGWFAIVLPALVLNYFGQGALLIANPAAVANPFYHAFPGWALYPMVALATAAAVIASQASITGTASLIRQAVQLGFLPRLNIVQTSARAFGQIYIPAYNWFLLVMVLAAVLGFGSSSNLAQAYGVALTGTMLVTTILTFFVIRYAWGYPLWLCLAATGFFNATAIERVRARHLTTSGNPARRFSFDMGLAGVISTQLWHHLYCGGGLCGLPTWSIDSYSSSLAHMSVA